MNSLSYLFQSSRISYSFEWFRLTTFWEEASPISVPLKNGTAPISENANIHNRESNPAVLQESLPFDLVRMTEKDEPTKKCNNPVIFGFLVAWNSALFYCRLLRSLESEVVHGAEHNEHKRYSIHGPSIQIGRIEPLRSAGQLLSYFWSINRKRHPNIPRISSHPKNLHTSKRHKKKCFWV